MTARISNPFRDNESKSEQIGMFKCLIDFKNNVGLSFDYSILYIEISKVQKAIAPLGDLCLE